MLKGQLQCHQLILFSLVLRYKQYGRLNSSGVKLSDVWEIITIGFNQ